MSQFDDVSTHDGSSVPSPWKRFLFYAILAAGTIIAGLAAAEAVLRIVPVPGIGFHTFYYDDLTGGRFYPNSVLIYQGDRGGRIRRRVNRWGYLGAEHDIVKRDGITRIGFFGDSFTEARQVPLEKTYYRIVESNINARGAAPPVECIAVSMPGYSTFQSYLEHTRWTGVLDLDRVVYVFCENDPGDNLPVVKRNNHVPYPFLDGDSLCIDRSFRERYGHKARWPHRSWQFLKSHSLVFSTLESRLRLLKGKGIQMTVQREEARMAARAEKDAIPGEGDLPSSWPDSLIAQARAVTEKVITTWRDDVIDAGRSFSILYIPRGAEMNRPLREQDSWGRWLHELCAAHGIDLIDPTAEFVLREARGEEIYYDHLTAAGHAALADVFLGYVTVQPFQAGPGESGRPNEAKDDKDE